MNSSGIVSLAQRCNILRFQYSNHKAVPKVSKILYKNTVVEFQRRLDVGIFFNEINNLIHIQDGDGRKAAQECQ